MVALITGAYAGTRAVPLGTPFHRGRRGLALRRGSILAQLLRPNGEEDLGRSTSHLCGWLQQTSLVADRSSDDAGMQSETGVTPAVERDGDLGRVEKETTLGDDDHEASPDGDVESSDRVGARIAKVHRAVGSTCSHERGPGDMTSPFFPAGPQSSCHIDADCAEGGADGRCKIVGGGANFVTLACSYDKCFSDDVCGGSVCACRPEPTPDQFKYSDANRCLPKETAT